MISKNFEFLKDYKEYKDYYDHISMIEDFVGSEYKYSLQVEACKFLEKLLKSVIGFENYPRPLGDLISEFTKYYREQKYSSIPSGVYAALKSVSANRNHGLHHNNIDFGEAELSLTTKINILQSLRKILHFIFVSFVDDEIIMDKFDDEIYYKNLNKEKILDLNTEYSYDNDQILINKVSVGDFVLNDKNNFIIPSYQRDYRWTNEECQELLNQLLFKYESNELVYFGTVACKIETNNNKENEIRLIDGQQRVTTSLILFKTFNDVLKNKIAEENNNDYLIAPELKKLFSFKDEKTNKYSDERVKEKYVNLTSNVESGQDGLYHILTGYISEHEFNSMMKFYTKSLVIENYLFFKRNLEDYSLEKLFDLYNYYANNFVLSCIKFDEENTNEMEIFENLNSKGKELDTFDMIKNYMYNMVDSNTFKNRTKEIVDEFKKYFRLNDVTKLKGNEDEKNKKYEEFLFNLLTYKNSLTNIYDGKIQKNKKSILKAFKIFYDFNKISFSKYSSICEEIGRYFKIYKVTKITGDYENLSSEFYFLRDIFKNLAHKDLTILYFRLIDIYSDSSWNKMDYRIQIDHEEEIRACLFEIEKWMLLLMQVRGTGQSFKESVYTKLIKFIRLYEGYGNFKKGLPERIKNWLADKIETNKDNENLLINEYRMPTKNEIVEAFKNKEVQDNNIKNAILMRLENYWLNLNTKAKQTIVFSKPTIEHIIPQKPSEDWKKYLSPNKDWDDEIKDIFKEHLNRIGNLIILDGPNNSELSNSDFEKKRKSYDKSGSRLALIPFTSKDENLLNVKHFGFEQVKDRSAKLAILLVDKIYNV